MGKDYLINKTKVRGVWGDVWLLRLERAAFGWNYYGTVTEDRVGYEVTVSSSGNRVSGNETHKYIDWVEFRRVSPFSYNPLFVLTELISRIWSVIRRIATVIALPLLILLTVITIVHSFASESQGFVEDGLFVSFMLLLIYVCTIILPTLIIAGLGVLWRRLFRIDERLQENLRLNDYDDDLSDCG